MKFPQASSFRLPDLAIITVGVAVALLLGACSSGNNNDDTELTSYPFEELVEQGVTRYLGMYSPMSTTQQDDVVSYNFGEGDGPLCLTGKPYTMSTRDEGTEDLMIFLQGGGACWFDLCAATTVASSGIPAAGVLDPNSATNPLAGISTVYLPYCDGGLFASDADVDSDDDGTIDRFHHGLKNLSAALDVAVQTFPAPRRIVLVGVSAGGYGTLFALPVVRQLYPGIPIEVINDSGIGITRPNDPAFNKAIIDYWNIGNFFPVSCPECTAQGSSAGMLNWQLQQDPDFRLGMLSYTQDSTIGGFFLGIGGPAFEAVLRPTLADVEAANPDRMRSFVRAGTTHTFLMGDLDVSVEGVSVSTWIGEMLYGESGEWNSVSD